jgi:hypothetical protein
MVVADYRWNLLYTDSSSEETKQKELFDWEEESEKSWCDDSDKIMVDLNQSLLLGEIVTFISPLNLVSTLIV